MKKQKAFLDIEIGSILRRQIMDKKSCKYHTLKVGFLYAVLSLFFLIWELYYILIGSEKVVLMLVPFTGLLICLVLGIILMLKDRRSITENNKRNNKVTEYCEESF